MEMSVSELAAQQLSRMRGMTRYYHDRFFSDIRTYTIIGVALMVLGWWEVPEAFALVPVVMLLGATLSAFNASYLILARHYAADLETFLNSFTEPNVLVGAQLEATYLFPLNQRKIVTAAFGGGFSYFGFMTLFITGLGLGLGTFGFVLAWPVLDSHNDAWLVAYVVALGLATAAAVAAGLWWFVSGVGERRLRAVLDAAFPHL